MREIEIIFGEYPPDTPVLAPFVFQRGDILFRLKKVDDQLYTEWVAMELPSYVLSDRECGIYFIEINLQ